LLVAKGFKAVFHFLEEMRQVSPLWLFVFTSPQLTSCCTFWVLSNWDWILRVMNLQSNLT